jgi:hypothetical protein
MKGVTAHVHPAIGTGHIQVTAGSGELPVLGNSSTGDIVLDHRVVE